MRDPTLDREFLDIPEFVRMMREGGGDIPHPGECMDLANLPQYQCHKRVRAVKVREIRIEQRHSLHVTLIPEDPAVSPFEVNEAYMQKHEPRAPGYFVLHDDGYQSWSPVEAFEAGYARIAK